MGEKQVTVSIPFVRTEASQNPNLRIKGTADPSEPYMRAMTVAFASVRRWNPEADLQLVSNLPAPADHMRHLERIGVEYKEVPFAHKPPVGFADRFNASLYMLDAIEALDTSMTILIDPDILCVDRIDGLLPPANHVAALDMGFPAEENINGLTRFEAGTIHGRLGEPCDTPEHYGGEVYVIPGNLARILSKRNEMAWELALESHAEGLPKFTTEEHILSYALRGVPVAKLNGLVRRIWTTHRYRQVNGQEGQLILWHLPAEKDRGFRAMYHPVLDSSSWFWHADRHEFMDRAGRAMGFHHRSPRRLLKDTAGATLVWLSQRGGAGR